MNEATEYRFNYAGVPGLGGTARMTPELVAALGGEANLARYLRELRDGVDRGYLEKMISEWTRAR